MGNSPYNMPGQQYNQPQQNNTQYNQPQQIPQFGQPTYKEHNSQPPYTQPQSNDLQPSYDRQSYDPNPYQPAYKGVYPGVPQKSKLVAGLLGIFLGAYGIHNFYLGNTKHALIQLLMTVCSCGILGMVSGIWGLVEGIQILCGNINTDARGVALKD